MLTLDAPRDGDIHTLADFAELLCLLTPDRVASRESISDYVSDCTGKELAENDLNDAFDQFEWRIAAFSERYPFTLEHHKMVLQASEKLNAKQQTYVLLLLCANLPFVVNTERQALTDAFERAAALALRRLWPEKAIVRPFGKNETTYKGHKWERLNALGHDIGGEPTLTEETYRKRDSGDGGIDLAAWIDLDDHEKLNIPSSLAQCACSRTDWPRKQNEISSRRLGLHLKPSHPWMEMIFIPQCFRNNHGTWAVYGDIGGVIVMDRLRVLNHLLPDDDLEKIAPPKLFFSFLETRLELV